MDLHSIRYSCGKLDICAPVSTTLLPNPLRPEVPHRCAKRKVSTHDSLTAALGYIADQIRSKHVRLA